MYQIDDYTIEASPRRVRAYFNGQCIADSRHMVLFFERPYPNYYFPRDAVAAGVLSPSETRESGNPRGEKLFWDVTVNGKTAKDAAFTYRQPPKAGQADLESYVTFAWKAMDAWFEEDERIYVHARNPYHRVDAVASSRHVQVSVDGTLVADTRRPVLLWETGLPTRYYIPPQDVRLDLLQSSDTQTACPYKGEARYYSVVADGKTHKDLAWWYPMPIPEQAKLQGLICFYNEAVDMSEDGIALERPKTHFR